MLSVSNTPSHLWAEAEKAGACVSRLLSRNSMYSSGAALGKSRLLYCRMQGMSVMLMLRVLRFSSRLEKLLTFSSIFSYWESATKTMPSTPRRTSWRVVL